MAFGDILKNKDYSGKEKHVPTIDIGKGKGRDGTDEVTVLVGKEAPHPNTAEHHIAYLELYGVKGNGQVVSLARASFGPSYTSPKITIETSLSDIKTVYAISYCNIHGLWENSVKHRT